MPTHLVNLDALIERADLALLESSSSDANTIKEIRIDDLAPARNYRKLIRKPDFQRETSNWNPEKISEFIASVVNRDFIPAVIMWESGESHKAYVIDGAHRLSALIAWVNDDYGDGDISRDFFGSSISTYQKTIANRTRQLVSEKVGAYRDLKSLLEDDSGKPEEMLKKARRLTMATVPVQWVTESNANAETKAGAVSGVNSRRHHRRNHDCLS